ncbi:MAG: acyltransferase family protein [Bacteroidales bacterium]|nr:acyltransferase family protein [Bacteroidales bacterium]
MESNNTKIIHGLDLLKFIMAVVVVSIHTNLFSEIDWLYNITLPLKKSAVPIFFVISSYLFFNKIEVSHLDGNNTKDFELLRRYISRLLVFYLFWFIIMLPLTIVIRKWYDFNYLEIIRSFFLGSTFRGSYFITALIIGVPIVFWGKKYIHTIVLTFISFVFFLIIKNPELFNVPQYINTLFGFSFLPNIFWIALGALLASSAPLYHNHYFTMVLLCLLYLSMLTLPCLLVLPAFVSVLFILFKNAQLKQSLVWITLRRLSILIFITHFVFVFLYTFLACRFPILDNSVLRFLVVLTCATLVSFVFLKLSERPHFNWLKFGL